MDKEILLKTLIDSRNEDLWREIEENYTVSFVPSSNSEYSCFAQNESVIFYVVESNLCRDSFTHEMLHIQLRINGCFIGAGVKMMIARSKILTSICSDRLIEHIGNSLDHLKMLPIFLKMGFDRKKFILDFDTHKCSASELNTLKNNYRIGKKIYAKAVDQYLGRFFSIRTDPNIENDYTHQLAQLKKIDPDLYNITEKMVNQWIDSNVGDYRIVLEDYYSGLKKWMSNKEFIG
ncbi:MAG: hypothetical protein L6Q66_03665 [Bacteroidia bacterium]|nr:hypothetical protein [Bacteroidia bacterium]